MFGHIGVFGRTWYLRYILRKVLGKLHIMPMYQSTSKNSITDGIHLGAIVSSKIKTEII